MTAVLDSFVADLKYVCDCGREMKLRRICYCRRCFICGVMIPEGMNIHKQKAVHRPNCHYIYQRMLAKFRLEWNDRAVRRWQQSFLG